MDRLEHHRCLILLVSCGYLCHGSTLWVLMSPLPLRPFSALILLPAIMYVHLAEYYTNNLSFSGYHAGGYHTDLHISERYHDKGYHASIEELSRSITSSNTGLLHPGIV